MDRLDIAADQSQGTVVPERSIDVDVDQWSFETAKDLHRSAVLIKENNPLNIITPLCFQHFTHFDKKKTYVCKSCVLKRGEYNHNSVSRAHIFLQGFTNLYDILPIANRRTCASCGELTYVAKSAATCDSCYKVISSNNYTIRPFYKLIESESFSVKKLDAHRL